VRLTTSFPQLLHAFFHDWLIRQLNVSRHTVIAYRDSWRLFLRFVAARKKRKVSDLGLADLGAPEVICFLEHLEQHRKVTIGTRNCRLAAIRSFFTFVSDREPLAAAQCAEILRIPTKRGVRKQLTYMTSDEVAAILDQPDRTTLEGQRDHALLSLLYNSGARIQEALDLCPRSMCLERPSHVRLLGKGRKERVAPIWPETAQLLSALLKREPRGLDETVFVNCYSRPLGASGVRYKLRKYVAAAAKKMPSLLTKHVSPHTFRHTTATHLASAGVDVTVIRDWLGHAQLNTTLRYLQQNIEAKRKALESIESVSRSRKAQRWKCQAGLLDWLDAL
jgi:site-specific recombinase XerD